MKRAGLVTMLATATLVAVAPARTGQAQGAASDPDIPVSHRDRVYAADHQVQVP